MSGAIVQHTLGEQDNFSGFPRLLSKSYTATVVCSNPIFGLGLKNILSDSCFSTPAVVSYELASSVKIANPAMSLVIFDWSASQPNAAETIRAFSEQYPEVTIAAVADQFSIEAIKIGLELGIRGFCLTSACPEVLVKSLELVMLQEVVAPASIVRSVLEGDVTVSATPAQKTTSEAKPADPRLRRLSNREAEILGCLMEGSPNKVIARKLEVTEATVKVHIKAILRKIGAANRTQAAIWATDHMPAGVEARI